MSIKIVDDHSIEQTIKIDGKTVATSKWTVSPDGNTVIAEDFRKFVGHINNAHGVLRLW
jgi:hypothetical protein